MAYTNTEDETKRKRELLFRFDILKKSYKEATIPEFTEYTDLVTMERVYEDTVRKVGLDAKVEGYKKFLTMGFLFPHLLLREPCLTSVKRLSVLTKIFLFPVGASTVLQPTQELFRLWELQVLLPMEPALFSRNRMLQIS